MLGDWRDSSWTSMKSVMSSDVATNELNKNSLRLTITIITLQLRFMKALLNQQHFTPNTVEKFLLESTTVYMRKKVQSTPQLVVGEEYLPM